jgi:hypothetical protein
VTERDSGATDGVAVTCDRVSTALAVVAGLAFLASFLLVDSDGHTTAVTAAIAVGGASLCCGGVSTLRAPQEAVGNTVPSPGVPTDETIRSRYQARSYAKLYVGIGLLLFVVGGFAALSTL